MAGFGVASARRSVGVDPEGSELGVFQEHGSLFGEICKLNNLISSFPISSGELRDAERMIGITAGAPLKGGDFIASIFDGVIDRADLDIFGSVKAAKKHAAGDSFPLRVSFCFRALFTVFLNFHMRPQCKVMYDHAILRLRGEFFFHEKECNNTASKQDSKARGAQGDKELGELGSIWRRRSRRRPLLLLRYSALLMPAFLPHIHTCSGFIYSSTFPSS